nr:transposase [Legionella fallonii]
MERWIRMVNKSALGCFDGFIATLEKCKPYFPYYFKQRKNSNFVEGLINKVKVATRRCYGFAAIETIFQRFFLDFQGLEIYA